MKRFALAGIALLLSGCAATSTTSQAPYYDYDTSRLVATGFPVSEVAPPQDFRYQRGKSEAGSREHASPGSSSARTNTHTFAWYSPEDSTAVMTALYESLDSGSRFLPQKTSDGFEFKGDQRFIYMERSGRYTDMAGDSSLIPAAAPECAASIDLLAVSRDERRRFIGVYTEGMPCSDINRLSRADWEQLRQRAYSAYGI